MAVNEDVSAYSVTAASNTPAGGDTVGPDLDNHLRDIKKNIRIVGQNYKGIADENFEGRLKYNATATPTVTISFHDGTEDIPALQQDQSANTSFPFVGSRVMTTVGAAIVDKTATASSLGALGLSPGTVGLQLFEETNTASARTRLDLGTAAIENVGTAISDVVELVTGSATGAAALPAVYGDRLLGLIGSLVQEDYTSDGTFTATSTTFPRDDTIPQNTEGSEALTLGFQPTNTSNKLLIEAGGSFGGAAAGNFLIALFQDATANALASSGGRVENNSDVFPASIVHNMNAGTSSATFKVRFGPVVSGTTKRNGNNSGRLYGGTLTTFLRVKEIKV